MYSSVRLRNSAARDAGPTDFGAEACFGGKSVDGEVVEAAGIEPASASATQQDTTCLAHSLSLAARYPKGREDVQPATERFNKPAWSPPDLRACERVPRFWMHKHMPGEG